ncbi:RNA polymerase sigma-I factor [Desulfolucanica intricata]|uniref:RNA polymerase sigma-I factor n=1 Tax=Desulfolucanica intricata TaxID=1285191 RepID=UPI000B06120B|nr:RNA polymerase sigma-I factor [Desulfolucanica intricata]
MLLPVETVENKLRRAKEGDRLAREELLENCKPFIIKVVAKICRRVLNWGVDDELSIGLIAMNEAIDRYEEKHRVPFLAYARVIINSRLTDYFRQENRYHNTNVSMHNIEDIRGESPAEVARAWEEFILKETSRDRENELLQYEALLKPYKIDLDDLVKCSPKHRDSRAVLLKTAQTLASLDDLIKYLEKKKRLPIQQLAELTGVHRKTLERGRKYIIATALVFYYKEEFIHLNWYLRDTIAEVEGGTK